LPGYGTESMLVTNACVAKLSLGSCHANGVSPRRRQDRLHRIHRDRPHHRGRVRAAAPPSRASWWRGHATTRWSKRSRSTPATRSIGNPLDPSVTLGPMASEQHLQRVLGYIDIARHSNARLVSGGGRPASQDRGWFVEPTVFADVDNSDRLAREEVFGPVMAMIPFGADDDAVAIANDSNYGLGGSVCPQQLPRVQVDLRQRGPAEQLTRSTRPRCRPAHPGRPAPPFSGRTAPPSSPPNPRELRRRMTARPPAAAWCPSRTRRRQCPPGCARQVRAVPG
jgi:Aldehyde dehydrogenase family